MSIAFSKYVRIISGVGGGAGVRQRDLIGRIISSNPLVPPDSVLEFSGATDVGLFFGTATEEYRRAASYFGYVSPSIASARRLSFSRWAEAGTSASVTGNNDAKTLGQIQAATAGGFSAQLGTTTPVVVSGLNLSAAASLAAAAASIQTALRAAGGAPFAAATVTYGVAGANRFAVAVPGTLGTLVIASTLTGANDLATTLGLNAASAALNITGVAPQTALDAVIKSQDITDNFGSFLFIDDLDQAEIVSIAAYNKTQNIKYIFCARTTAANASALSAALIGYGGTALTLFSATAGQFPDQVPMTILAATDYTKRNSVQNYMFRQFADLTALVSDTGTSDAYDALRVNYYGQTQTAGQKIAFYQRGKLMGVATDPSDMNVYANEAWLKDYAGAQIMSLQLSISRIPANDTGRGLILNILQPVVNAALFNGCISVGKTLTPVQKVFISQQTGNDLAWRTVEGVGYILSVSIESYVTTDGSTEYKAVYALIYAKDDAIRLVEGTHSLI